jgi:Ca2+-binding RTX toxin-like protein
MELRKEHPVKRRHVFLIALVAAFGVVAFGATDAFASYIKFNNSTGQMTYTELGFPGATYANNVRVHVDPNVSGFYVIEEVADVVEQTMGDGLGKYCYIHDYHGFQAGGGIIWVNDWSCPASSIVIQTESGDDTIAVDDAVKIPTVIEGGAGTDSITGGSGPDVLRGGCPQSDPNYPCSGYFDVLLGGAGNDEVHGGPAGDYVHGGLGNDTVDGGPGNDSVYGDSGDDLVGGGPGADKIYGSDGTDIADYSNASSFVIASLDGNANDGGGNEDNYKDTIEPDIEGIQGGSSSDTLVGDDLPNILAGGEGDDTIVAGGGNDLLFGQGGSDMLRPGLGQDNIHGGSDANSYHPDTVTYDERTNPVNLSIDGVANDGEAGENDYIASDVENLIGGYGKDTLIGDAHGNKLEGGSDNDTLIGNGGGPIGPAPGDPSKGDVLEGDYGNDLLDGGPAGTNVWDTIDGGNGTDMVTYASRTDGVQITLDGTAGPQSEDQVSNVENVKGGSGDDLIIGNDGPNTVFAYAGNDRIDGKGGNDVLGGGVGNDWMAGSGGHDVLSAGEGADLMDGGPGPDFISGHEGIDTVTYDGFPKGVDVSLDNQYNDGMAEEGDNVLDDTENVIGSYFGDRITGSASDNKLVGSLGPDQLIGGGGADTLDGGASSDTLDGGDGPDTLVGGTENDQLFGRAGYDTLRGGPGSDKLTGGDDPDTADYSTSATPVQINLANGTATGEGTDAFVSVENAYGSPFNDEIVGDQQRNTLSGFEGDDKITGGAENDRLFGAAGDDTINGELGNDEIAGGLGTDTVTYGNAPGGVTVDMSTYAASATGGAGNDWLSGVENVTGSAFADSITGSSAMNILLGGSGNDTLAGLGGNDTLNGQGNVDSLDGGANVDSCLGETLANCEK